MQKEEDNGIIIKGINHILQCALENKEWDRIQGIIHERNRENMKWH